jgi:membrane-associated protease RseP (regulator of RpoE activity)
LEPAIGHTVDGIIGSRLFDDFVVMIDYENQWVSIYEPKQYRPSGKERALPVRIDAHGFSYVDASISLAGTSPVAGSFLVDGGANTYADIYKPFSDAHRIPPSSMKLLNEPGTSTGGTTESKDGRANRLDVGPFSIKNPPITFAQDVEGLMATRDYAGLIGTEFLKRFTVVFDSPGKRILLTPNRSYGDAAEYDESGLRIRAQAPDFHKFVVTKIVPNSPAQQAGLKPGDIIESIDNRRAAELTLTQVRAILCRPKARYTIDILRGSSRLKIPIQLQPLI